MIVTKLQEIISYIDPSELHRPEFADKDVEKFRDYHIDENDPIQQRVRRTYRTMHLNQTVEFVKGRHEDWLKFNHFTATLVLLFNFALFTLFGSYLMKYDLLQCA